MALESEQHVVLDFRAGSEDVGAFLEEWERRSGLLDQDARTLWDDGNGWLVTRVGRRERAWGRLVIESPAPPSQRLVAVAERAAAALAMHRLHDRTRDHHVRRLHQELLQGLQSEPGNADVLRRVELAGIPVTGCTYVGMALRPTAEPTGRPSGQLDELVAACLRAAELVRRPVLVAAFESDVRLLMAVPARSDPDRVVDRFVEHLHGRAPVVAAQGSAVTGLEAADRTLRESLQVLASAGGVHLPHGVLRLHDLHVRGTARPARRRRPRARLRRARAGGAARTGRRRPPAPRAHARGALGQQVRWPRSGSTSPGRRSTPASRRCTAGSGWTSRTPRRARRSTSR